MKYVYHAHTPTHVICVTLMSQAAGPEVSPMEFVLLLEYLRENRETSDALKELVRFFFIYGVP